MIYQSTQVTEQCNKKGLADCQFGLYRCFKSFFNVINVNDVFKETNRLENVVNSL